MLLLVLGGLGREDDDRGRPLEPRHLLLRRPEQRSQLLDLLRSRLRRRSRLSRGGGRLRRQRPGPVPLGGDLGQAGLQLGRLLDGRPPGVTLVGQGHRRPSGVGLGGDRRLLGPAPGGLGPGQALAGVALGSPVRLALHGVGRLADQLGQLLLPPLGPGQVEPPRPPHVALGDGVHDPGPELLVAVEHPPGRHQRRAGQLGEMEEGPQGRGGRLDGGCVLAGAGHGDRSLQRRAQQGLGGRGQPLAVQGASANCSTALPDPHHRQETSSTVSVRTSSSSTVRSPPSE